MAMTMILTVSVLFPIVRNHRRGSFIIVRESRAGIGPTDGARSSIGGSTSSEPIAVSVSVSVGFRFVWRDNSEFMSDSGGDRERRYRRFMFRSSRVRGRQTESKSDLGFRFGKPFTLLRLGRSEADHRHRVLLLLMNKTIMRGVKS